MDPAWTWSDSRNQHNLQRQVPEGAYEEPTNKLVFHGAAYNGFALNLTGFRRNFYNARKFTTASSLHARWPLISGFRGLQIYPVDAVTIGTWATIKSFWGTPGAPKIINVLIRFFIFASACIQISFSLQLHNANHLFVGARSEFYGTYNTTFRNQRCEPLLIQLIHCLLQT